MSRALQSAEHYSGLAKRFKAMADAAESASDKSYYLKQAENYLKLAKPKDVSARPVLPKGKKKRR